MHRRVGAARADLRGRETIVIELFETRHTHRFSRLSITRPADGISPWCRLQFTAHNFQIKSIDPSPDGNAAHSAFFDVYVAPFKSPSEDGDCLEEHLAAVDTKTSMSDDIMGNVRSIRVCTRTYLLTFMKATYRQREFQCLETTVAEGCMSQDSPV